MEYIVFDLLCIQTPLFYSSGSYHKLFGVWKFFKRIIKIKQKSGFVVRWSFNQVKIYLIIYAGWKVPIDIQAKHDEIFETYLYHLGK